MLTRLPPPAKQLLWRQTVSPCHCGHGAAGIALGDNLSLLLSRPGAPPPRSGKHLEPLYRLALRFVQKLSVRHVSNPLDSAIRHSPINS